VPGLRAARSKLSRAACAEGLTITATPDDAPGTRVRRPHVPVRPQPTQTGGRGAERGEGNGTVTSAIDAPPQPNDTAQQPGPPQAAMNSWKRYRGPGLLQRITCYLTSVVEATPGGRVNRMQPMRHPTS
jgi:hypothetical protein